MTRKPVVLSREEWASDPRLWHGRIEGREIGTGATVLFFATEEPGKGPRWHVHPYDELFIIRTGRARFKVGDETFTAKAGQIVLGPANIPHKYTNLGPGLLESIDIHMSERWIQTDLDDPDEREGRPQDQPHP